jgi:RHS repeat-associated protein
MATEYGYDALGRNTKITEKIDAGKSLVSEYKYNAKNQVEQFIYPGGKALKYEYAYGDLKKMTWAPAGVVVWEKLSENAKGQVLSAKAGNGLQTNYLYAAAGTPTSIKTLNGSAAMLNISYLNIDSRGNIGQRRDDYRGLSEAFTYDNLNRLSSNQDAVSYAANGNITSKAGAGSYTYNSSKPHAVSRLDNAPYGLMEDRVSITYNSINRPVEASISSAHKYTLTYGTDNQRVKSVYVKPGATTQTKYYAGPYEEIVRGSSVQKNYYIHANGGIAAVYTEGHPGLSAGLYYFHNDHLGSPWLITTSAKGEVQRLSYDAWGRRRDAGNWSNYSDLPAMKFDRGYTGHEHLEMFGLINMNARLYNPALGRFLGADPFVQAPDFSQAYNRYAYANNNPMMYTDPSGEYVIVDDIVAAVIGGTINLVVNAFQGNLGGHGLWGGIGRGAAAFGAGAVGGLGALYPEFGGWALGGATVGATNSWLSGAKGWDIAIGAGVGAVSGFAGGAAGQWGGQYLGGVIINGTNISSPVLQGAVTGAVGGAAGGYTGGFTAGMIMTGDFEEANKAGWQGAAFGAPIGGVSGSVSAYKYAKNNDINPWNGKSIAPKTPTYDFTLDPLGNNVTLYRGTTGTENGKGPLFMTDNPDYAAGYVANGGKVIEVTIPRSTLNQMCHNGVLEYRTGTYYGGSKPYTEYMFSPLVKFLILNR